MAPRGAVFVFVQKLRNSVYLLPVVLLIIAVLGSIYAGIATATEAAVLGVTGSLILSALQRSLTRASFVASLMGALRTSCMRSEEHTSELQSLMRISYAVFCLKKKNKHTDSIRAQQQPI